MSKNKSNIEKIQKESKKSDYIRKVINDNQNDFYILSLRFINNKSNGNLNKEVGSYLIKNGWISLTGDHGTGTCWIIDAQKNINKLTDDIRNLVTGASFRFHIFKGGYSHSLFECPKNVSMACKPSIDKIFNNLNIDKGEEEEEEEVDEEEEEEEEYEVSNNSN